MNISTGLICRILSIAFFAVLFFHLWGTVYGLVGTAAVALAILP